MFDGVRIRFLGSDSIDQHSAGRYGGEEYEPSHASRSLNGLTDTLP